MVAPAGLNRRRLEGARPPCAKKLGEHLAVQLLVVALVEVREDAVVTGSFARLGCALGLAAIGERLRVEVAKVEGAAHNVSQCDRLLREALQDSAPPSEAS